MAGKKQPDSGGDRDLVLGAREFSWGVTPQDRALSAAAGILGLLCLAGLALVTTSQAWFEVGFGMLVVGGLGGEIARQSRPAEGDSFEVFEHGVTDGGRTLLFERVARVRLEAHHEVTTVGGVETERTTRYEVELEDLDGTRFSLAGYGESAANGFGWFREHLPGRLPAGIVPEGLPAVPGSEEAG